jgi:hypothetical protein
MWHQARAELEETYRQKQAQEMARLSQLQQESARLVQETQQQAAMDRITHEQLLKQKDAQLMRSQHEVSWHTHTFAMLTAFVSCSCEGREGMEGCCLLLLDLTAC